MGYLRTFRNACCNLTSIVDNLDEIAMQAAELPLSHVPEDIVQRAIAFFGSFDLQTLSAFAVTLVDVLFREIPESAAANPPKAKARQASLSLFLVF